MTTLLFTTSSGFLSWAIRLVTRSHASHSMITVDFYGMSCLLHCTVGGVQITPRAKWLRDNVVTQEFAFVADVTDRIPDAAKHLNERFDYVGFFGFGIVVLAWRWFKKKIRNPIHTPTSFVCSEFVLELDRAGVVVPEWSGLDPERTTCQTLIEICERSASFRRIA